jgi:hypothetical protein
MNTQAGTISISGAGSNSNWMKIGTDAISIMFQFVEWKQKINLLKTNKLFNHLMKQLRCWRTTNLIIDQENYEFLCNLVAHFPLISNVHIATCSTNLSKFGIKRFSIAALLSNFILK